MQKGIAKKIAERYDISVSGALVGAILYGNDANLQWRIGQVADMVSLDEKIDQLKAAEDGNNILKALEIARDELFSFSNGARRSVPKTLILFASEAKGNDKRIDDVAKQLKDNGVKVIVLALGSNVTKQELSGIASDPSQLIALRDPKAQLQDAIPTIASKTPPGIFAIVKEPP